MVTALHDFTTGAHQASCTIGNRSFPGVKQLRHGIQHPPPSSAEFTKNRAIPLLPVCAFMACWGWTLLYLLHIFVNIGLWFHLHHRNSLFMCLLVPENTFKATNNNKSTLWPTFSCTIIAQLLLTVYVLVKSSNSVSIKHFVFPL